MSTEIIYYTFGFCIVPSWFFIIKNKTIPDKIYFFSLLIFFSIPGIYTTTIAPIGFGYSIRDGYILSSIYFYFIFTIFYLIGRHFSLKLSINPVKSNVSNNISKLSILLCGISFMAKLYLIEIDRSFIREAAFHNVDVDIPTIIRLFQNVHLPGFLLFSIYYFKNISKKKIMNIITIFSFYFVTMYTIIIEILQARRTGVVLPFVTFIFLSIIYIKKPFKKIIILMAIAASLFMFTTAARSGWEDTEATVEAVTEAGGTTSVAIDAIVGRVGNPFIITTHIAEHTEQSNNPFKPHTIKRFFQFIIPFGNSNPFHMGNNFGRQLNLLSDSNTVVGLNTGWVGEAYLDIRFFGLCLYGFIYGFIFNFFGKLYSNNSDFSLCGKILLFIFGINGFQMEISYPLYTLIRGSIALGIVSKIIGTNTNKAMESN